MYMNKGKAESKHNLHAMGRIKIHGEIRSNLPPGGQRSNPCETDSRAAETIE